MVLASNNQGKLTELQALLDKAFLLKTMADYQLASPAETGMTFVENAIIKARYVAECTGLPALADDSGLCVPALHGAPGLYSSRYGGEQGNHQLNIKKLLAEMKAVPTGNRQAYFYCVVVLMRYADDPAPVIAEGRWSGAILTEPAGKGGFGYDPVFFVPERKCSAAELPLVVKNQLSHRGQALKSLRKKLVADGIMF